MSIKDNLEQINKGIPEQVRLVAVSKTKPIHMLEEAYSSGQRCFGENKALDLQAKAERLPKDIKWHFIGHLQTNKVKYITPYVSLIEAVDSIKILKEINKQAAKSERVIDCLLQFHIAEEESKFGLSKEEAENILQSESYKSMKNIRIVGVMGMATYTEQESQINKEFLNLKLTFDSIKSTFFANAEYFKEISMGMSGDYRIAIENGSTNVRIGSSIFGHRNTGEIFII